MQIISDDDFPLENLQKKKLTIFAERLLTNLLNENSCNFSAKSSTEENKIIYGTIEDLDIFKVVYNLTYIATAENFHVY